MSKTVITGERGDLPAGPQASAARCCAPGAASVTGAVATVGSVALAIPIGQAFAGTPMPAHLGVLGAVLAGLVILHPLRGSLEEVA